MIDVPHNAVAAIDDSLPTHGPQFLKRRKTFPPPPIEMLDDRPEALYGATSRDNRSTGRLHVPHDLCHLVPARLGKVHRIDFRQKHVGRMHEPVVSAVGMTHQDTVGLQCQMRRIERLADAVTKGHHLRPHMIGRVIGKIPGEDRRVPPQPRNE